MVGVVHPEFRPLQNRDAVSVFDALVGHGEHVYHTGGYLGNGEVIWLLAKLPDSLTVGEKDVVEPYMLLTNSHDGTIAIDIRLTMVRVVCQNTLALAMRKGQSSQIFKRAHNVSPGALLAEAKKFYQISTKAATEVGHVFKKMHAIRVGKKQLQPLLENLLPLPRPPAAGALPAILKQYETRKQKIVDARNGIAAVFTHGCTNRLNIPPAEKTLWGALNSVTAFVDHKQEIDGDRYAHILFGSGASLKEKAYQLVVAELSKRQSGFRRLFG